ncbi:MAG: hypothetical protein QXO84_03935 [Candidatus Aenigmatarchaeota archaeon]
MIISIDEVAALYIASCHIYEGRPHAELANQWKERFLKGERLIPEEAFCQAFPHAYKIYISGRNLQDYFESLYEGSHNWLLWMFLVNAKRRLPPQILSSIITHMEYCCVKIGRVSNEKILISSLSGEYELSRNLFNFLCKDKGEYYFLHGFDNGVAYAIRPASEEDFERYKTWFEEKRRIISKLASSCPLPQLYREIPF